MNNYILHFQNLPLEQSKNDESAECNIASFSYLNIEDTCHQAESILSDTILSKNKNDPIGISNQTKLSNNQIHVNLEQAISSAVGSQNKRKKSKRLALKETRK